MISTTHAVTVSCSNFFSTNPIFVSIVMKNVLTVKKVLNGHHYMEIKKIIWKRGKRIDHKNCRFDCCRSRILSSVLWCCFRSEYSYGGFDCSNIWEEEKIEWCYQNTNAKKRWGVCEMSFVQLTCTNPDSVISLQK